MNNKIILQLFLISLLMLCLNSSLFADDIGYTTAGITSNTIGNEGVTNLYGSKYTSVNGGTLTSAYINGHNNWNGTDTVVILIYDDTGGYPHTLIAESAEIVIDASSYQWWSASISGTIASATDYWLFVRNKTVASATVRVHYDANTITGYRATDGSPTDDPFANGATVNNNNEYSIYIFYTTGGGGASPIFKRRRKLQNILGGIHEKKICLLICLLFISNVSADVVNNSGSSGADSLTFQFYLLDSLGSLTDVATTDSIGVVTFYPEGAVAYNTVVLGNNSNIVSQSQTNIGTCYSYGIAIADIDGASPSEGVYTWMLSVKDISLGLTTMHTGTFQLYTGADYNSQLDNLDALITSRSNFNVSTDTVNSYESGVDNSVAIADLQDSVNVLIDSTNSYGPGVDNSSAIAVMQDSINVLIDSVNNLNASVDNSAAIAELQDSVNVIIDSLSSSGAGMFAYKVTVVDSSNSNPVNDVSAYLRNLDQTVLIASGRANSSGELLFNLDIGSYLIIANAPGYIFNVFDTIIVTGAGEDSLYGYAFDPGQPALPNLCRAYAYIYDVNGTPEPNATITASLPGGVARSG